MKTLFTYLLLFISAAAIASPTSRTYEKLAEINKCWTEQQDINHLKLPAYSNYGEHEWIRIHLQLVEQTLRTRNTEKLSATQKANRLAALDHLNQYWHEGNFPINDKYSERTPIFIDPYDNFCAVGYLVKATGHEDVSRMISANTNLAYVREMNYPELNQWAKEYGFTTDELAWIQPSYMVTPSGTCNSIGKGTDSSIYELFTDQAQDYLYVGGKFRKVDSSISSPGIAQLSEKNGVFTWHAMGDGLDGTVYAITEHQYKIYAAGKFSASGSTPLNNVAYWNGTKWNAVGCLDGTVRDLQVANGILYACGEFDICNSTTNVNFAKWDGTSWQAITGLNGKVNVMMPYNGELILGGEFSYNSQPVNVIKWKAGIGFTAYSNTVQGEVNDIQMYKDTIILVAKTEILKTANNTSWTNIMGYYSTTAKVDYKTVCTDGDTLRLGGDFLYMPPPPRFGSAYIETFSKDITYFISKDFTKYSPSNSNAYFIDSTVNKFTLFKGALIAGGEFVKSNPWQSIPPDLNHIFFRAAKLTPPPPPPPPAQNNGKNIVQGGDNANQGDEQLSVSSTQKNTTVTIYPNPAKESITITNNFGAKQLKLYSVNGQEIAKFEVNAATVNIPVSNIAAGTYIAELSDAQGNKATQKIVIE